MLAVAIILIVLLVAVFVTTFVINHKTPAPKGCEDIKIGDENCASCQKECPYKRKENEQ